MREKWPKCDNYLDKEDIEDIKFVEALVNITFMSARNLDIEWDLAPCTEAEKEAYGGTPTYCWS